MNADFEATIWDPADAGEPAYLPAAERSKVRTVKFQIAKQSGSKPIYILLVAVSAFNLGRYSEHFSGSSWAWVALACNAFILCLVLFSMMADYRKNRTM